MADILKLVMGRAGTGKSEYILNQYKKCIESGGKALLIVPEQFTVTVEKTAALKVENRGEGEVLNFKRLCNKIFTMAGGISANFLDDGGKCVIMSSALEAAKDNLNAYAKVSKNPDFISRLLMANSELTTYCINAELLGEKAKELRNSLQRQKIGEIALVLQTYDAMLKVDFADSGEDLDRAASALKSNNLFSGYSIFLDSFKGFTPQEYALLLELLKQAAEVYITLPCDEIADKDGGYGLFSQVKDTASNIKNMAQKLRISDYEEIILTENHRFKNDELLYLEKNLFEINPKPYEKMPENITVFAAKDLFFECFFTAGEISRLVREKGYRYRDIVVITRSLEDYKGIIDAVFSVYEIPLFCDIKAELLTKPLILFIMSAFDIIAKGFSSEHIFNYLKTGLTGHSVEDICSLQNYVAMWGINGKKWSDGKRWNFNPDGFEREISPEGIEFLNKVNDLRDEIVKPLLKLKNDLKNKSIKDMCAALYDFLFKLDIPKKLEDAALEFKKAGNLELASEQERIWDVFIKALDQTAKAGKDRNIDIEEYAKLFKLVISNYDIGIIPTSIDEVQIGSADRIRARSPKCVFVLGVNDGVFPKLYKDDGLLTDADRRALFEMDIELAPTTEEKTFEEPFFAYTALTCASDFVYVSYRKTGLDGREERASYIINSLLKLFPQIEVRDSDSEDETSNIERKRPSFDYLMARGVSKEPALFEYFKNNKDFADNLKSALKAKKFGEDDKIEDEKLSIKLFGENLVLSPTRLESYFNCRFKHFCEYGLNLKAPRKAELAAPQTGIFIHHALENIIKSAVSDNKNLWDYSPEELKQMASELSKKYVEEYMGGEEEKTSRFKYLYGRLKTTLETLLTSLASEFKQSGFKAADFELKIGDGCDIEPIEIPISGGGSVKVRGTADRVDVLHKNDCAYIRIVDYKTGVKKFNLNDVFNGLNLQMLIYLFTIKEKGKDRYGGNITPAGVLYYPAQDPVVPLPRHTSDSDIEEKRQEKLKQNGLLLADIDILSEMERDLRGKYIPVETIKDGTMSKKSSVATIEEFGKLKRHIEKLLMQMGGVLRKGGIEVNPFKDNRQNSCRYCDMLSVCGFEPSRSKRKIYARFRDKNAFFENI